MLPVGHFEHQGSQIKGFGRLNKFRELLFSGCLRAAVSTVKLSEFAVTPVLPHTILHVTLDHSLTDDVTVTPTPASRSHVHKHDHILSHNIR